MKYPPGFIVLLIQIHVFPLRDQITMSNGSLASDEWIKTMLIEGLIEFTPAAEIERSPYQTTARGRAYVEKLCSVELPVLVETWT